MAGRGGFSEVFKAFDLHEFREVCKGFLVARLTWCVKVACKIHRLHSHWNDERKRRLLLYRVDA